MCTTVDYNWRTIMLSRLLAMSLIGISLTGCNTMHGMGQDFNSVFAPSKNTSGQTIFGSPTSNTGAGGTGGTSTGASGSSSGGSSGK